MTKRKRKLDPMAVPLRHRLLPLHLAETTEKFLGITPRTCYLVELKAMILGETVR